MLTAPRLSRESTASTSTRCGPAVTNISIEIFPRIHMGLVSMHADGPRQNGGIGFAVDGPSAQLHMTRSPYFTLDDTRSTPISVAETEAIASRVNSAVQVLNLPYGVAVSISGGMMTHHGMGSGTAIRLACLEGLLAANNIATTSEQLVKLSGRGGTSGIGICSYFAGGFVFDLGISRLNADGFLPSSHAVGPRAPLLLKRLDLPNWSMGICIPANCHAKTQAEELEFFQRTTPLDAASAFEAAYVSLFGVTAAALEQDYRAFCSGIDAMQRTTWKSLERLEYGENLRSVDNRLREIGVDCVGMSSLGPLLYFFGSAPVLEAVRNEFGNRVSIVRPRNEGRRILRC
ncbi:beta-ribofuranosylaminobenzene 5'-phosphate synthase family protein [Rhizobium leguminosarum]|uniref:beta-ribofuranosylaminobenzene 5'-phosphate synthase family protein n=1 Tax=Rhizobium leguminosarum TaxID=384 RepID=UPI003F9628A1